MTLELEVSVEGSTTLEVSLGSPFEVEVSTPSPPGPIGPQGPSGNDPRVGDMAELSTQNKDTIVGALNEVNVPSVPFTLLYENAKAG